MFIKDKFHPKVNVLDEFEIFIVVEISYEGQVLWLVVCMCLMFHKLGSYNGDH